MAKIIGPLMSLEAHGSIGPRLTFSKRASGQQVRFQNRQVDVNTAAQQGQRAQFLEAVADWNALTPTQQQAYNDEAKSKGLNMTGYNYYIQQEIAPAWFGDWAKRIAITIDNSNIDSDLDWFPIPIILGTSVGQDNDDVSAIFDEVGSNWQKIAVTKIDNTTQLYVEKEQWDSGNEKAVLWVSKSDLTLSSSGVTTLYIYYDNSKDNNTAYVADVGSRTEVWDNNFQAVYHLRESGDGTAGEYVDSTSNNNDGQGGGGTSNETPTQTDGQIGKGQDFNGTSDWIKIPNNFNIFDGNSNFTVQALINADSVPEENGYATANIVLSFAAENMLMMTYDDDASNPDRLSTKTKLSIGGWSNLVQSSRQSINTNYCHAFTFNTSNGWVWYENGLSKDNNANTGEIEPGELSHNKIGYHDNSRWFNGILDEIRISNITRSAAWIKADYHAEIDDLLSYGSEETNS